MNIELLERPVNLVASAIRMAAIFKALSDPTRLRIYLYLRRCCNTVAVSEDGSVRPVQGVSVGDVCCQITGVDRITSTLSHHLKELRIAGLIRAEKHGRHIVCSIDPAAAKEITAALSLLSTGDTENDCCS
jgi:ArsR family transcriptional regulator